MPVKNFRLGAPGFIKIDGQASIFSLLPPSSLSVSCLVVAERVAAVFESGLVIIMLPLKIVTIISLSQELLRDFTARGGAARYQKDVRLRNLSL